jgi:hypothetical protein
MRTVPPESGHHPTGGSMSEGTVLSLISCVGAEIGVTASHGALNRRESLPRRAVARHLEPPGRGR